MTPGDSLRVRSLAYVAALRTVDVPAGYDQRRDTAREVITAAVACRPGRDIRPEALVGVAVVAIRRRWAPRLHDRLKPATGLGRLPAAWRWLPRPEGTEDDLVDAIVFSQVWGMLTVEQQQTLEAVGVHGTGSAAAAALGIDRAVLARRLSLARIRVWVLLRKYGLVP